SCSFATRVPLEPLDTLCLLVPLSSSFVTRLREHMTRGSRQQLQRQTNTGEDCPAKRTNLQVKGRVSIDRSMVTALLSTTPRQVPRSSTDDSVLKNSRYVNSGCNSNGECKPDSPRMLCHQVMGCVEKDNSSTAPDWPKPVE